MQGPKSSNMTNAPFLGLAHCAERLNKEGLGKNLENKSTMVEVSKISEVFGRPWSSVNLENNGTLVKTLKIRFAQNL